MTRHTATLLADGKVLIAGGSLVRTVDGQTTAPAELYDTRVGTFEAAGNMTVGSASNATLLPSGKVLFAGGDDLTLEGLGAVAPPAFASAELFQE